MDKVSIIIPVYNTEKYLKKCIESVLNQTYKNIEMIIVDDGSTDNSWNIIQSFCNNKRVIAIQQENSRQGAARNKGINASSGKYIVFLDSDDYLPERAVEILLNTIKNNDIAIGNMYYANKSTPWESLNNILTHAKIKGIENLKEGNLAFFLSSPCNKIYKRDFLIKNNILFPEKMCWEDGPFNIECCLNTKFISFTLDNVYYRTIREDEDNKSTTQLINNNTILDDIKSYNLSLGLLSKHKKFDLVEVFILKFYNSNLGRLNNLNNKKDKIKLKKEIEDTKNKWKSILSKEMSNKNKMAYELKLFKIKIKNFKVGFMNE